jgi:hypothetical protein
MMLSRRQLQQQSSSRAAAAASRRKCTLQHGIRYSSSSINAVTPSAADNDEHAAANALLAAATAPVRDNFPPAVRAATVAGGYRGLVATRALREGDVVLAVPLANALVVPGEKHEPGADATCAAAALIESWQAAHGIKLPAALSKYLVAFETAEWDVRLAAWLLWLLRRGEQGRSDGASAAGGSQSLWDLYASVLPAPEDCSSFFDFTDDEAEAWLPYAKWRVCTLFEWVSCRAAFCPCHTKSSLHTPHPYTVYKTSPLTLSRTGTKIWPHLGTKRPRLF